MSPSNGLTVFQQDLHLRIVLSFQLSSEVMFSPGVKGPDMTIYFCFQIFLKPLWLVVISINF